MSRDSSLRNLGKNYQINFVENCEIRLKIPRTVILESFTFLNESPLEISEAFLLGDVSIKSAASIELVITRFHPGRSSNITSTTLFIPFFLLRGPPLSILSSETFTRKVQNLWNSVSPSSEIGVVHLSDYLVLWATAGLNKSCFSSSNEFSWLNISAIVPDASFLLRKIKSYPLDVNYFRYCIQTDVGVDKFSHLCRIDPSNGNRIDYRFGFFLMDSTSCLVPYLDGDPLIESSVLAGVWVSGVEEVVSCQTWLALFRYAFALKQRGRKGEGGVGYRRVFCTSPVLAVHDQGSNKVAFYSIHSSPDTLSSLSPNFCFPPLPTTPGYSYLDKLEFHLLSGFGSFNKNSDTATLSFLLKPCNSSKSNTTNPEQSAAMHADYVKFLDSVVGLGRELNCQVLAPTQIAASMKNEKQKRCEGKRHQTPPQSICRRNPSPGTKNYSMNKRSVKFNLPYKIDQVPPSQSPCEVPDVSLLVEEGVCVTTPQRKSTKLTTSADAVPRHPPHQLPPQIIAFTSPPPKVIPPYDPCRYYQPLPPATVRFPQLPITNCLPYAGISTPCYQQTLAPSRLVTQIQTKKTKTGEKNYTLLEALIQRLLSQSLEASRISATSSCNMTMASVGTNTSALMEPQIYGDNTSPFTSNCKGRANVACNTSLRWPTLSSIGLEPIATQSATATSPSPNVESIGTQCEKELEKEEKREFSIDPSMNMLADVQWSKSLISEAPILLDCWMSQDSNISFNTTNRQTQALIHCSPDSAILVDSSPTPQSGPTSNDKTINPLNGAIDVDAGYNRLLAGIEKVLHSSSHLHSSNADPLSMRKTHSEPSSFHFNLDTAELNTKPSHNIPTLDADSEAELLMQRRLCEAQALRLLNNLEPSSPPSHISESAQTTLSPSSICEDSILEGSRMHDNKSSSQHISKYGSGDESALIAGLVKKYLPKSPISTTTSFSSSADFSLSTQRYLEEHGLIDDDDCYNSSHKLSSYISSSRVHRRPHHFKPEISTIVPLPTSSSDSSPFSNSSTGRKDIDGSRILDLEHLRSLPKYL